MLQRCNSECGNYQARRCFRARHTGAPPSLILGPTGGGGLRAREERSPEGVLEVFLKPLEPTGAFCEVAESKFVVSRPRLPSLQPPRAPMLPAIADVLRSNSPQQQHENHQNARTANLPSYTQSPTVGEQYLSVPSTFSATFMTYPNNTDYRKRSGLVLPSLPGQIPHTATGDMTPPGLVGARTCPIPDARPANRICKFAGCTHYVVDHGLCVRHGGGKRCIAEGCSSRAKHFGRCWRHGGSLECKASGCSNRAKSRGYCWSHGGGTKCKMGDCDKIAISNGLCWGHGGGKRCVVRGCRKQAYERTCNYCNSHFQQYKKTALELAQHNVAA